MQIRTLITKTNTAIIHDILWAIRSRDHHVLQPIALFGSMILSMSLTFFSSIITARALGPSNYGDLKYIGTVWSLLALIITFGYFYSGSRVLVLENDIRKCREIYGTIIFISLIMGIIISLVTVLIAYPLDSIFHVNVGKLMAQSAPLIIVIPLGQSLSLVLQSTNRVYLLAILNGVPSVLYIISILMLSSIKRISTGSVLLAQQITILMVIIYILMAIKPSLRSKNFWWGEIKKHHKTYGFPVYRGALAGVGSTYLNRLAISYWVDNTAIGFFSLASSLVTPLSLIPNSIATSSFRSFATSPKISKRLLLVTIMLSFAAMVMTFLLFGTPLSWIYTTKFQEVGPMARALAFGALLVGFGDLFNRFLGAHGNGKAIQRAAYANGIATVICIFVFVPVLGVWGAILSTLIPNGIYLLLLLLSYRAFARKSLSTTGTPN